MTAAEEAPKRKPEGKSKAQPQEKSPAVSKLPPAHPPVLQPPEKKTQQAPAQAPLQPPTLPPAQPPVPAPAPPPATPLNSTWADNKSSQEFLQSSVPEDPSGMALPPPPSIPPPPAPGGVKPKAICPGPPPEMDPGKRNIERPPPGIDLGLLLTGPAPGLSPQPVLPPPGMSSRFPEASLAPAEAAAVSAVQGLGTDSFFGGAPGFDFGGFNQGLGAIGLPPGIAPKAPLLLQPGDQEYYQPDPTNRLGMFNEPPATSLFSSPFGMFGPIGSHSQGLRFKPKHSRATEATEMGILMEMTSSLTCGRIRGDEAHATC